MFIYELVEKFTDATVIESNHAFFYPIHYFSKDFFKNYKLWLEDGEHVLVDFPGIIEASGYVVDYSLLDTFGKKAFFILQHWMYFSHRAGGTPFYDYRKLKDKSIFQWCLFLHILNIFVNFGHDGLERFRKTKRKLGVMDLDRYEKNAQAIFTEQVFDHIDSAELYEEIDDLYRKKCAIKFKIYCKSTY